MVFDKRGTGMSDPVTGAPTLEERADDVRAVMDAAGVERAALFGVSEGAPMCLLFAAAFPDRTAALVLFGAMARSTWAEDYPWATPVAALRESAAELIEPYHGEGMDIEIYAPSWADIPGARERWAKAERQAASPGMVRQIYEMFLDIDVRSVLPAIRVPTLVLHRRGDRVVNWRAGRWLADQILDARYVELAGIDHMPWVGDADAVLDEVEEFLTGTRASRASDRVLATVLFTDIVGSTEHALARGDLRWRELLGEHDRLVRDAVQRFRGRTVKGLGDGVLATFDGPARAIRCAQAICAEAHALGIEVRAGLHTGECELMGEGPGRHCRAHRGPSRRAGGARGSPGLSHHDRAGGGIRYPVYGPRDLPAQGTARRVGAVCCQLARDGLSYRR